MGRSNSFCTKAGSKQNLHQIQSFANIRILASLSESRANRNSSVADHSECSVDQDLRDFRGGLNSAAAVYLLFLGTSGYQRSTLLNPAVTPAFLVLFLHCNGQVRSFVRHLYKGLKMMFNMFS